MNLHQPKRSLAFLRRIKDFSLPIAIAVGIIFWKYLYPLEAVIPYMIGSMLFFTFLKLSPRGIRLLPVHWLLALLQLSLGILSFYLLTIFVGNGQTPWGDLSAQGTMICFVAPAATASAVIISMMGGNIGVGASYVLLTNTTIAFVAPLLFSLLVGGEVPFWQSVWQIFSGVSPLVFSPLALAWLLRYGCPRVHRSLSSIPQVAFWLWVISLAIILAHTVKFIVDKNCPADLLLILSGCGLAACIIQFALGKWIGAKTRQADSITIGQSLGQKNTTLAIWMAQMYLNPISSIAPASYIIWQNSFNSFQLWLKSRKDAQQTTTQQ